MISKQHWKQLQFAAIAIAFFTCTFFVQADKSISQISPKSVAIDDSQNEQPLKTSLATPSFDADTDSSRIDFPVDDDSDNKHERASRSVRTQFRESEKFTENESGRYFNLIQPTNTLRYVPKDDVQQTTMSHDGQSSARHFLLKRGPRLVSSMSPSSSRVSSSAMDMTTTPIRPTSVSPSIEMQTAASTNQHQSASNFGRQNPNADIQDIITGIVKLLNGNVNVHANTQPQVVPASRRPHTRINNRGPPRISDAAAIDDIVEVSSKPTPATQSTMRYPAMPAYPFDRPDVPVRPFISGVPLPEQIVPPSSGNNYRPMFVSQPQQPTSPNRPPWKRRPRPPITTNVNRRPMLTPPPYRFSSQPAQDLQPPEIDSTTPHFSGHEDSQNSQYDVTDLLENEQFPTEREREKSTTTTTTTTTEKSTTRATTRATTKSTTTTSEASTTPSTSPSKEELTKNKRDKLKKPTAEKSTTISSQNRIVPTTKSSVEVVSKTMKTVVQTESEVHTSQKIISSPTLEPSEQPITSRSSLSSSTSQTPELASQMTSSIIQKAQIQPTQLSQAPTPTNFHPRPGIVLDDPEFKPGGHARPNQSKNIQPTRLVHRPLATNLPPGYGEIFDVTLSAIQGLEGGAGSGHQTIKIKPAGVGSNDIIVTANGEDSFVSIDGKRTYLNLFGESTDAPIPTITTAPTKAATVERTTLIQPTKTAQTEAPVTGTGYAVVEKETPQKYISSSTSKATQTKQTPILAQSSRPQYRPKTQQPPVRIDTCIVGDDSTCDQAHNERCKTEAGVSSCHCRPGFARRKHREPCRRVVSLLMSMRVDKFFETRVVWDKQLADPNSELFNHLSFEAIRAIDSAMSMTPFSDEFMDATVNKIYNGDATQGVAGVFVNMTIELEENGETTRPNVKSDIQKHLLGVIHRRNNNIGNSALYVESPPGSISNLQDLDECTSRELNDCHAEAMCANVWGSFRCQCRPGFRDPWSDQPQRAGRECQSCSDSYCNNRGTCSFDQSGAQVCECAGSYYGTQCEVDGEVLAVAIGASVIAVIIIVLTLICLVMWSRRWHREQKEAMGSPIFGYMSGTALGPTQLKAAQATPYEVTLQERMRWAQIADAMTQSNHYAAEPVVSSRPPSAMYGYPNIQMMQNMHTLSMASTLPLQHHPAMPPIPMPRYALGLNARANGMRTLENSSSSEEEDRTDLLGRNFHVPRPKSRSNGSIANQSGIYYDVDYEPSGNELYGGTTTTTTTSCNANSNNKANNSSSAASHQRNIPMSTYATGRVPSSSYFMK